MDQDLRYELKMAINGRLLPNARNWLRLHPAGFRTAYPTRLVNSLYLDTPHLNALTANIIGVSDRQKLRLRWYGDFQQNPVIQPVLELKFKHNLVGGKQRFALSEPLDLRQPWSIILATLSEQVPSKWRPLLTAASQPTLINQYHRDYFVTPDSQIRATLDYAQKAWDQRLSPRPNWHHPLPSDDLLIIEIKGDVAQAERLEAIMAHFPAQRTRNSKYANGLLASL
ncbi:MAG: polyphosphate polymerase domain-containing protein [Anaerolineales bacterium]|nr:polyphosphate polymerase domain-containing protein [Anaerolineales bacterium]